MHGYAPPSVQTYSQITFDSGLYMGYKGFMQEYDTLLVYSEHGCTKINVLTCSGCRTHPGSSPNQQQAKNIMILHNSREFLLNLPKTIKTATTLATSGVTVSGT